MSNTIACDMCLLACMTHARALLYIARTSTHAGFRETLQSPHNVIYSACACTTLKCSGSSQAQHASKDLQALFGQVRCKLAFRALVANQSK